MELNVGWHEIAVRLLWTVIGGTLIGINREEHGRAAGLRTTLLVCLAASISMIQVNLLLGLTGKASNSFIVMDLMRLPLGILSGMGFIGAGAILHRDNLVLGVTTAATLWFVTVMGLCFGGGQIDLGIVALALGFGTLSGLKWFEKFWKQDCAAVVGMVIGAVTTTEREIEQTFIAAGYKIRFTSVMYGENGALRELLCEVRWRSRPAEKNPPEFLQQFASRFSLLKLDWRNVAGH